MKSVLLRSLLLSALIAALLFTLVIVIVGHLLTSDWPTIWSALTALAASITVAAVIAAALYAKGQLDTARTFQQIHLTIQQITTYTPFIVDMNTRANNCGTWTQARDATRLAIQANDEEAIENQQRVLNVMSEFADLHASGALHPDLLFRRLDFSICRAWFIFEDTFNLWGAANMLLLDSVERLVKDAYSSLKTSRSALVQSIPELRHFKV